MKNIDIIHPQVDQYIENLLGEEPQILQDLNRETWQKVIGARMISGHFQGRVLSLLSKIIQPKNILELGTFTGYSTLCLAEGMKKEGHLTTIDINEELGFISRKFFDLSPYKEQITQKFGPALDIIPQLNQKFDLVFLDADKDNYSNYFDLIKPLMNPGGVILSDNVLWYGKVTFKEDDLKDKATAHLKEFNQKVADDKDFESFILPIRDGIYMSRKK